MPSDGEKAPLVGRGATLQALHTALLDVEHGETAAVFLTGEGGVGKTRLLAEAAFSMRQTGAVVLSGVCLDIGDAVPLHPLRHALRRLTAEPAAKPVAKQAAQQAVQRGTDLSRVPDSATVAELLTLIDGEVVESDGASVPLERVARGLGRLTGNRPLVLLLDDLQWADRTTRQLLLYLLAGLTDTRLLVLAAIRAEDLGGGAPLRRVLTELRRLRTVRVLELPPLTRAETEQLTTAIIGKPVRPDAAELMWKRSGGNPLVVEELARDARDGKTGLSDTLREIFLGRVDALPAPARTVVHAVSAGVEPVAHELLARVVPLSEAELIEALRLAVAKRILTSSDDGGYRLRHRLVAEVLETESLPVERAALHRRYAEAVAASGGAPRHALLAHHWRLAGRGEPAYRAAVAAAREAERLHGFAEAHEHFTVALRLLDSGRATVSDTDRAALLYRAAEAAHRCGEHDEALRLLDQLPPAPPERPEPPEQAERTARVEHNTHTEQTAPPTPAGPLASRRSMSEHSDDAGAPENLMDASGTPASAVAIRRARYLAAAGRTRDAERECEQALAEPDCPPAQRASAAAHLAELLLHLGRYADAGRRARQALELGRAVPDSTSLLVRAGAVLGFSQAYLEDPGAGLQSVRQALRTAETSGRPDDIGCAYLHLAELLTGPLNQLEEGVVVARRGAGRMAALGLGRTFGSRLLAIAANGLFRIGQWAEAEMVLAAAFQEGPSGSDAVELLLARGRLLVGYGEFGAADRDLDAAATLLADSGGARHLLPLLTLRAGLAMWRGQHAEAREAVRQGLAETKSDDMWLLSILAWHGLRAEAEAHAGGVVPMDPATVASLRDIVKDVSSRSATAAGPVRDAVAGYQELCNAELSRLQTQSGSDPDAWARVAARWHDRTHPYPEAYAKLRQAEALFARRARGTLATSALREAYRLARDLGAVPLCSEIKLLASRARVSLEGVPFPDTLPVDTRVDAVVPDAAGTPAQRSVTLDPASLSHLGPLQDTMDRSRALGPSRAGQAASLPGAGRRSSRDGAGRGTELAGQATAERLTTLTARELEVLEGVAEGLTNREIARRLFISERTIGVHVSHILEKLQVRSRVQASGIFLLSARHRPPG